MTKNAKELAERVLADLKTSSHPGKLDDYRDLCFDAAPKLARAVLELSEAHGTVPHIGHVRVDGGTVHTSDHDPCCPACWLGRSFDGQEISTGPQRIRELMKENERLRSDVERLKWDLCRMTELRDEAEQRQDRYFGPAPPGHIYEE